MVIRLFDEDRVCHLILEPHYLHKIGVYQLPYRLSDGETLLFSDCYALWANKSYGWVNLENMGYVFVSKPGMSPSFPDNDFGENCGAALHYLNLRRTLVRVAPYTTR